MTAAVSSESAWLRTPRGQPSACGNEGSPSGAPANTSTRTCCEIHRIEHFLRNMGPRPVLRFVMHPIAKTATYGQDAPMSSRSVAFGFAMVCLAACSSAGSGGGSGDAGVTGGSSGSGANSGTGGIAADGGTTDAGGSGGSAGFPPLYCESTTSDSCTCVGAGGGAQATPGEVCTPESVGGGVCCAQVGYPEGTNTCQCSDWGCFNGSVCSCGYGGGKDTKCDSTFAECCVRTSEIANPTSCRCTNFGCDSDETVVTSCGLDIASCNGNRIRIDKCTP